VGDSSTTMTAGALPNIPTLTVPPITRATLACYAIAGGDDNPIHIDSDFAKAAGFGDVFAHGMLSMAYLGRMLTDRIPPHRIRSLNVRFRAMTHVGDVVRCSGKVVEKFSADGEQLLRIELKTETQSGTVTLVGEAVVAHP
jgi:acyl dehydratase